MPDSLDSGRRSTATWSPLRGLVTGTLLIGVLDGLDAIIVFGLRSGATPGRIFQTVASGVLGSDAYSYGLPAALFGVTLHFCIAGGIMAAYLIGARLLPALRRHPWRAGPGYGVAVYFVMNLVVVPLSAIGVVRFTPFGLTNGLLIHVFGVGLPAALVASRVVWRVSRQIPPTGAVSGDLL
jgi:hypothetical protein